MIYLKIIYKWFGYNYWLIGNSTQIQNLPKVSILKILVSISWIPILFYENDFYLMFWKSYWFGYYFQSIRNSLQIKFETFPNLSKIVLEKWKWYSKSLAYVFKIGMNSKSILKNGNNFQKVWLLFHSIKNLTSSMDTSDWFSRKQGRIHGVISRMLLGRGSNIIDASSAKTAFL